MTRDSPATHLWAWLGRRLPTRAHRGTAGQRPPEARAPAKGRRSLDYPRAGCVGWVLGKVLEWLVRLWRERREMSRDGSHGEPAAEPGAGRGVLVQGGARRP
jgi:hypothetical protein